MNPQLGEESRKLAQSWMRHSPQALRDYLVAEVEDPRINLQSILTRHFILREAFPGRFERLMMEEYRFSAAAAALGQLFELLHHPEESELVLYALDRGSDNAEGIPIPPVILRAKQGLPREVEGVTVPDYIELFLRGAQFDGAKARPGEAALDVFPALWTHALEGTARPGPRLSVLEPACGSANDYRFFPRYGLAPLIDYTGFDICPANIDNARALFPGTRFEHGNVFEIQSLDRSFDACFVHDLFEHLSLEGLSAAVEEVCRITRKSICAHFFNMDEIPEHQARPVENYHWNTLSLGRVLGLFETAGFKGNAVNIGAFIQRSFEAGPTHNANAYTLYLQRSA